MAAGGLGDISFSSSVINNNSTMNSGGGGGGDGDTSAGLDVSEVRLQALKDLSEETFTAKGRRPKKAKKAKKKEEEGGSGRVRLRGPWTSLVARGWCGSVMWGLGLWWNDAYKVCSYRLGSAG